MAALGIDSLHLTPTSEGKLKSGYPAGNDGSGTAPSVPVLSTPVATGQTTIDVPVQTLSTGPSTPITYVLERSTSAASGFASVASGDIFAGDGIASLTGMSAGTTYYFRCKAVGANLLESAYSTVVSVATSASAADTTVPTAPGSAPTLSAITSSDVTVTWPAGTDNVAVTGYDVLRGLGDGAGNPVGSGTVIATTSGLTYTDSGLSNSQQYYYRIRSKDAAGNVSGYTNRTYGTTLAGSALTYDLYDDFQSATIDLTKWANSKNGGVNTFVASSTDYALPGKTRSAKCIITRDSGADFRAEINDILGTNSTQYNTDNWYGMSFYLPSSYVSSIGRDINLQFHHREWLESPDPGGGTSPCLSIECQYGNWRVLRRPNPGTPPSSATQIQTSQTLFAHATGVWSRWVLYVKWHWSSGVTRIWKDGVLVYSADAGNCANLVYAPFLKTGCYDVVYKTDATLPSPRISYRGAARILLNKGGNGATLGTSALGYIAAYQA